MKIVLIIHTHQYNSVKVYQSQFIIFFIPNAATSSINPGFNESHWTLKDDNGNIIKSRINNANSTIYRDTVNLPDGCYEFTMDDDGCDGLSWWAYQYYTVNPGTGVIRFNKISPAIPIKIFNGDFGCQVTERFIVNSTLTSIKKTESITKFMLYPNPASSKINVLFDMDEQQTINYVITDITGKEVKAGTFSNIGSDVYPIEVDNLLSGMYFITCNFEKGGSVTKKFIIEK
ncbi:MAG: T9SS type A sorting domain-containing protein [Bacteroidetes bacterium]|nr:T9SS type A sorting domain-containing protein [Bacteroidota bacterium]